MVEWDFAQKLSQWDSRFWVGFFFYIPVGSFPIIGAHEPTALC